MYNSGYVGPKTKDALRAALSGEPLTDEQASYLRGAMLQNKNLSPVQKAALASALQNDADEKRRLAASRPGGSGLVVVPGGGGFVAPPAGGGSDPVVTAEPPVEYVPTTTEPRFQERAAPPAGSGVRIAEVSPGGAAERAGLRAGDVITQLGPYATPTFDDLRTAVGEGGVVQVVFVNAENGQLESLTVDLSDRSLGITCG